MLPDAGSPFNRYAGELALPDARSPSAPNGSADRTEQVRQALARRVGPRSYERCFQAGATLTVEGHLVTVGAGSPFVMKWMQREFRPALAEAVREVVGPAGELRFVVRSADAVVASTPVAPSEKTAPVVAETVPEKTDADEAVVLPRRQYASLDELVVCPANELAVTAARQVCERPGEHYNPLVLSGGVGVGKTHLLEGVAREVKRRHRATKVMFLSAEEFANHFTAALRDRSTPSFRARFRGVDVLLIDDFDFFQGKKGIAEELLHTFRQLESRGKQVVLTVDRHPRLLTGLSDELVSRCLSGLFCRLETPDAGARERILRRQAEKLSLTLASATTSWIAKRFTNVREGQGAVNVLATHARLHGEKTVSLAAARQALSDLERDCARLVGLPEVEAAVCKLFGLSPQELRSAARTRSLSQPRTLAMFLARKHTRAAYSEIGAYFGGRNHSTVIAAEKRVAGWLSGEDAVRVADESWSVGQLLETLDKLLHAG